MTTSTDYALLGLTPGIESSSGITSRPSNHTIRLGLGFPRTVSNDALSTVLTTAAGLDGDQLLCLTSAGLLSRSKGRGTLGSAFCGGCICARERRLRCLRCIRLEGAGVED